MTIIITTTMHHARRARTCRRRRSCRATGRGSARFALAFAVGIRPCTGAILVLVFAIGQGLWWAGVFSTFAMALGTAITVSALATMAVGSRELAKRLAGSGGSSKWATACSWPQGWAGPASCWCSVRCSFVASLGKARSRSERLTTPLS